MINVLAFVVVLCAFVATWHFFYESIISPNKITVLRTELLLLEAELSLLDINKLNANDKDVYRLLSHGVENLVNYF
ncbi:hypothetical protein A6A19_07895 [Actinobacillus delphinicola]|uniref:hypothetical protein n=1 Tax=Actinobacillus delphinicola TaxID=51161 RepID=UPI002443131F|nr:hypothetical protein [Actinobacillus delphinicola]MDG6897895.1 hypothetical protein [Actinobacillus delphinicola]